MQKSSILLAKTFTSRYRTQILSTQHLQRICVNSLFMSACSLTLRSDTTTKSVMWHSNASVNLTTKRPKSLIYQEISTNCSRITGCANQLPSIDVDEFFTEIFFPNITSEFWKTKEELRDSLVIYAIHTAPNSNMKWLMC